MKSKETTTRRSELTAEIAELQNQQLESFAAATFAGFTPEQNTAHLKRSDRMEALQRALNLQRFK
jgi:hypothetical protein